MSNAVFGLVAMGCDMGCDSSMSHKALDMGTTWVLMVPMLWHRAAATGIANMTNYRTVTLDNGTGTATHGVASVRQPDGTWCEIGRSNDYREYPRAVRAHTAAFNICKAHHKSTCEARNFRHWAVPFDVEQA
jgi:hypothetical protein